MAALAASQALQSRSAYFPGDSEGDASSSTTVNTSASQPRRTQDAAPPSSHSNPVISRASFASAYRHKSAQVQSSSAVRAWRFPSSRRFLWDRTATGPCVHLHPQVICVQVLSLGASNIYSTRQRCALYRLSCRLSFSGSKRSSLCKSRLSPQNSCIYPLRGMWESAMLFHWQLEQVKLFARYSLDFVQLLLQQAAEYWT